MSEEENLNSKGLQLASGHARAMKVFKYWMYTNGGSMGNTVSIYNIYYTIGLC